MEGYGFRPDFVPSDCPYPQHNPYPPGPGGQPSFPSFPMPQWDPSGALPNYPIGPPSTDLSPISPSYGQPHSAINSAFYWYKTDARSGVPSTAMEAGIDSDGTKIYAGRAFHEGDWIPAKVIPEKNIAYIAYGGSEHPKTEYEVLCETKFDWVEASGSNIPFGAVTAGRTSDGEALYLGRVYHQNSHTVGKVQPSHGCCYIPYDGEELSFPNYEILVLRA